MSLGYSFRAARVAAFGFVALVSAPAFAACGAAPTAALTDSLLRLKNPAATVWAGAVEDAGSAVAGDFVYDGTNNVPAFCNGTSWIDVAAAGGSATLNGILAATANQAGIANAAYTIQWNWDTLAGGSALTLSSVSTAAASNAQEMLNISLSGTNGTSAQKTYGEYISNTHAGTTSTNFGLYATASGGTNHNYAIYGTTSGTNDYDNAVYGNATGTSGIAVGVSGYTASASGYGVLGQNTSGGGKGVVGVSSGTGIGVEGSTSSTTNNAQGVYGEATGATGTTYGVMGTDASATGYGGYFTNTNGGYALVTNAGNVGIGTTTPQAGLDVASTTTSSAIIFPRDTTANRPTAVKGMMRYNTTFDRLEAYQGDSTWQKAGTTFLGKLVIPEGASCKWTNLTASWVSQNSAQSSCGTVTVTGQVTSPGKYPAVTIATLPAGDYEVTIEGDLSPVSSDTCGYRWTDGTTFAGYDVLWGAGTSSPLIGVFSYATPQSNITFTVQSYDVQHSTGCEISDNDSMHTLEIWVKRF